MLSTVTAPFLSDPILGDPFTAENGFTPWDCAELLYPNIINPQPQSPKPLGSSSGSHEPNEPNPTNSNSGSDGPSLTEPGPDVVDERKRRRMVSNRESARRSRMRKQKHLHNLRNQVTRMRVENRELTNRLSCVLYHCHGVKIENHRLRSEQSVLLQRLNNIKQILMFRRLQQFTTACPCNNNNNNNINMIINSAMTTSNEQTPSLIAS